MKRRKGWRVGGHRPALQQLPTAQAVRTSSPRSRASLAAHGAEPPEEFLEYDPEDTEYHMDQNDFADALGGSPWGDD